MRHKRAWRYGAYERTYMVNRPSKERRRRAREYKRVLEAVTRDVIETPEKIAEEMLEDESLYEPVILPVKVGGPGDCWKKLWRMPYTKGLENDHDDMTFAGFVGKVVQHDVFDPQERIFLEMILQDDGDWHLERAAVLLEGEEEPEGMVYARDWICSLDPSLEEWWDMDKAMSLFCGIEIESPAFSRTETPNKPAEPVYVGSDAASIVASALQVHGPDLAKTASQRLFDDDLKSTPSLPYRMTTQMLNQFSAYIGSPVVSTQRQSTFNDHIMLQAARHLIREELRKVFPHNQDSVPVLHVGATMTEVKGYWSHASHDFAFALKEDKDSARMHMESAGWLAGLIRSKKLPMLKATKNKSLMLQFPGPEEVFRFAEAGDRKRAFIREYPNRKYGTVLFQDCLYKMSPREFETIWETTDADTGYAVMFFPDPVVADQCAPSDIYEAEKYLPTIPEITEFIRRVWPACTAFTPLIPIDEVMGAFETAWQWCRDQGLAFLSRMWESWTSGSFPIETILGNAFDVMKVGPIVRQLMELYWPMLYERLCRISVTWKNGFAHGYDEKLSTWRRWLRPRHRFKNFCVDMEVQARFGEMYLLKFHRSTGASPIVTKLCLPKGRQIVMVADIEASYDRNMGVIGDIKYFPVLAQHWYKILNWCLDQPPDSLSFAVVMTTLNRIRGGLSLGSRKLVEEMNIEDGDVAKIALAALMESYNRHAVIDIIENDPEMRSSYETHLAAFLKKAAVFGLTIATGGLAVPAYFVFRWLWAQDRVIEFVRYPSPPKIIREPGVPTDKLPVDRPVRIVLPGADGAEDKPKPSSCFICDLQKYGHFSHDYEPANGQAFHVRCHGDPNYSFKFSEADIATLRNVVLDAETAHGQAKVTEHIKTFKKYIETHADGMDYSFELDYIMGGPGTGKSVVLRKLAKHFEEQGQFVVIESPFNALLPDYISCDVLGYPGKHTFEVNTTWYTPKVKTADVLIVDEITAVDWDLTCAKAKFLGVKRVIVAGDHAQTGLRPEVGEGTNLFDRLGPDAAKIRTHELVYNYRMDAWRVKLHNHVWGYKMIPKRTDHIPPKVVTLAEYKAITVDRSKHREMVFAHASSEPVFGVISQAGPAAPGVVNMSVRSAQGRTSQTAAVALLDRDSSMAEGALLNVANSRATHQTYYVVLESTTDPVAEAVKERLHIATQEQIDEIAALPDPEPPAEKSLTILDREQIHMQSALRKYKMEGNMWADGERVYLEPDDTELVDGRPVESESWVWAQFETCLLDPVRKRHPELELEMRAYLLTLWSDDDAMGRTGLVGRLCRQMSTGSRALTKTDGGKYLLPVTQTLEWLDSINVAVVLYTDKPEPAYVTKQCRRTGAEIVLALENNHVTEVKPKSVSVQQYDKVSLMSPLTLVKPGTLVLDLPLKGKVRILHEGKAPAATDPSERERQRAVADAAAERIRAEVALALRRNPGAEDMALRLAEPMEDVRPTPAPDPILKPFVTEDPHAKRLRLLRGEPEPPPAGTLRPSAAQARTAAPSTAARTGEHGLDELGDAGGFGWKLAPYTMKLVPKIEFDSVLQRDEASARVPVPTGYMVDPTGDQIEEPSTKTKARFGTNAYLLHDFIDPSGAAPESRLNYAAGFSGVQETLNLDVDVDGILWRKTKAGKPVPHARRTWRQVHPGLGNHFTDHPVENIQATKRYSDVNKPAKRRTAESDAWCRKIVDEAYREHYRQDYELGEQERNYVVFGALAAAKQRNYWKRGLAARSKWAGRTLIFSGKSQFKPEKNGKLDLEKAGQGLMQSPPDFNHEWIGWARVHNFMLKDAALDNWLTDNRESEGTFRTKVSAGIQGLPGKPKVGMVDAKTFDALQSQVTVYIENLMWQKFGTPAKDVDEFQDIRKPARYMAPGQFKGKHTGQKGSGFLDTLSGNTMLEMVLVNRLFHGQGPRLDAGKGDDFIRVQNGLTLNKPHKADIASYTGIEFTIDVGYGGEFIGCTVSDHGMYPSITRTAIKTMGARIRDAKHLQEYQQSLRDKVLEWRRSGFEDTVAASADAERKSVSYVEACLAFVESFSHITWEQYQKISKTVHEIPFTLPPVNPDRAATFL